jgi:uncharacterized cupredoxin-like copper-binding protein
MRALAIFLTAAAFTAACGGGGTTSTGGATATLTATLKDTTIQLDQPSAASGTVTFKVVNAGSVVHSLILLKTDVPHDKLALDPKDASKVDPAGLLRETGQIPVGQTKEFSVKLAPGNYVLVCNEPAHYQIGMHLGFTVK